MPRRLFPVPGIHVYRLRVSPVIGVVPAAVGKVDSANERDVPRRVVTAADDEQFLVMAAEEAHPLIQQHLAAGVIDLAAEELIGPVTHGGRDALSVGSPDQAAHFHSRPGQPCQQLTDRRSVRVSRSSPSPRQSVNHTRSPACRADSSSCSRAK